MRILSLTIILLTLVYTGFCQQQGTKQPADRHQYDSVQPKRPVLKEVQQQRDEQINAIRSARARKMASVMADSLALTSAQHTEILNINMNLEHQKSLAFKSDTSHTNIGRQLNRIERQRDNLYHGVLSEEQFKRYNVSKRNLN